MNECMIKKWETTRIHTVDDYYIFNVLRMERKNPLTGKVSDFVVIDSQTWVNVIPITTEKKIIFVRQYRHGVDEVTLELPGGLVESEESTEESVIRETLEETGYASDSDPILLGVCDANPAFMNNECHSFLLENCYLSNEQKLDSNEIIEVVAVPMEDVGRLVRDGVIRHPLVLSALLWYAQRYGSLL
jgi:8-oxo-dGTP pyrophosphatase MutT (NUDIX family)